MINLEQLKKQHSSIEEELDIILSLTFKEEYIDLLSDITLHINKLAGLLNIHLLSEDDFMYPALRDSKDTEIKNLASSYSDEMGGLVTEFTEYKNRFNTKNKVLAAEAEFRPMTKTVLGKIKSRMDKENKNLYRLIAEKNL